MVFFTTAFEPCCGVLDSAPHGKCRRCDTKCDNVFVGRWQTAVPQPFGSSSVELSVLPASLCTMAARLVLDVNRSPEPFVCWVSALGVKEAGGPLVLVVPYTFDHPNRRLTFVMVSSLEDLAVEPFLD